MTPQDLRRLKGKINLRTLIADAGLKYSTILSALGDATRKARAFSKDEDKRLRAALVRLRKEIDRILK